MWPELLITFGGPAVLIAAIAWLARSVVLHLLSKDVEKFKQQIQTDSAQETARLRHSLQLEAAQFKTTWDLLHAKRAEVIEELYGKLIDFVAAAKSFAATIEWSGGPDKKEKGTLLWQRASEFSTYFQRHRIYFSENTCQKIDDLFKKLTGPSQGFSYWLAQSEKHAGAAEKMHDAWETASRTITTEAPQLVAAVEHDFRSILGVAKER